MRTVIRMTSVGLLLLAVGCAHNHPGYQTAAPIISPSPEAAATQADQVLASQVRQQFYIYRDLAPLAPQIQISAQNGTVTLTGAVPTEQAKQSVEAMARSTTGVLSVNDQLTVAPSAPSGSAIRLAPTGRTIPPEVNVFGFYLEGVSGTDRVLVQQILDGLKTDTALGSLMPNVRVSVADGKVALRGTVANDQQKQAIVSAVQRAAGVNNVSDQLQVQSPR